MYSLVTGLLFFLGWGYWVVSFLCLQWVPDLCGGSRQKAVVWTPWYRARCPRWLPLGADSERGVRAGCSAAQRSPRALPGCGVAEPAFCLSPILCAWGASGFAREEGPWKQGWISAGENELTPSLFAFEMNCLESRRPAFQGPGPRRSPRCRPGQLYGNGECSAAAAAPRSRRPHRGTAGAARGSLPLELALGARKAPDWEPLINNSDKTCRELVCSERRGADGPGRLSEDLKEARGCAALKCRWGEGEPFIYAVQWKESKLNFGNSVF